jgi:hypothetical protein
MLKKMLSVDQCYFVMQVQTEQREEIEAWYGYDSKSSAARSFSCLWRELLLLPSF